MGTGQNRGNKDPGKEPLTPETGRKEQDMTTTDKLNEIADRIYEHIEAGGGILDENDHDDMMQTIQYAIEDVQFGADDAFLEALQRAKNAMQRWNDEEYPYLEDIISDMFPEGIDDGNDLYDED